LECGAPEEVLPVRVNLWTRLGLISLITLLLRMMLFVFDTIIFGVAYVWSLKL